MPIGSVGDWDRILENVEKQITLVARENLVWEPCCEKRTTKKSNIIEVLREDSSIALYEIAESEEIQADAYTTSRDTVQMIEYGVAPAIKERYIEDEEFDIIGDVVRQIGLAFATQKNTDFFAALAAGVPAANTYPTAAAWNVAAGAPLTDVSMLLTLIQIQNYGTDPSRCYLLTHPLKAHYLRILAALYSLNIYGPGYNLQNKNAIVPNIFGMPLLTSTRCSNDRMYLVDRAAGSVVYYERKPITVERDRVLRLRTLDIVAHARFAFYVRVPNGVSVAVNI